MISQILAVLSGGVFAQLISFLATPFITRIYSPESFGLFANVTQISAFIIPIMTLTLPMGIVLVKRDLDAKRLSKGIICQVVIVSLLVLMISGLTMFFSLFGGLILFYATILALFMSIQEVLLYYLIRNNYFYYRSLMLVFQSVIAASLKICIGRFYDDFNILCVSAIISYLVIDIFAFLIIRNVTFKISMMALKVGIRKFDTMVKFRTPINIIDNLCLLMPVITIASYFSPKEAGLYALARTTLVMPGNLLGKSISDVIFPKISYLVKGNKSVSRLLIKSTVILMIIGVIPSLVIFFYSREIYEFVFGNAWSDTSEYSKWIMVWVFFNVANKPYTTLIPIFKLEKITFYNSIMNLCLTFFAMILGVGWLNDSVGTVIIYSMFTTLNQIFIFLLPAFIKENI